MNAAILFFVKMKRPEAIIPAMAALCEQCSQPRYPNPYTECLFGRTDSYPWPFSTHQATEILKHKGREALQDYVARRAALSVYPTCRAQFNGSHNPVPPIVCLYVDADPYARLASGFVRISVEGFVQAYLSRIHEPPALQEQREDVAAAHEGRPAGGGVWTIAKWFQTAPIPVYNVTHLSKTPDKKADPLSFVSSEGNFCINTNGEPY